MTKLLVLLSFFGIFGMLSAQVTPVERAALEAFYLATNGDTWTSQNDGIPLNDWDFTGLVTDDWYGLTIAGGNVVVMDMNPTNYFTGGNIQSGTIPDELADLIFLTSLDISAGGLTGTLPVSITTLPNLQSLNVWSNELTGNIPIEVTDMTGLVFLNLSNNDFTGTIYPEYGDLTSLQFLYLSENNLTGVIPTSLGDLLELRVLRIGDNALTGNLPISLRNLTELIELSIQATYIDGNLPEEYSELTNLQILDLSSYSSAINGGLTGSIPDSYGDLINLIKFDVWGNALTGSLPLSLSNWVNIAYFSIENNLISGTLPASYSSWTNIIRFEVFNNDLEGSIPDSYSSFTQMEYFSVNDNNLSGELSPNFSQWVNLTNFNVSNNNLSGTFPPSYDQWNNLTNFNVNNNELEGALPDFTIIPGFTQNLNIADNRFQFGDFENEFQYYDSNFSFFRDNPQAKVNDILTLNQNIGEDITLTTTVSGTENHYQWFKNGVPIVGAPDSPTLTLTNIQATDAGIYHAEITSDIVTDLILVRNDITVIIGCVVPMVDDPDDVIACESYTLPTLTNGNYFDQPNGSGTPFNAGDIITVSQTLYVYAGISGCSNETNFEIQINNLIPADNPGDVIACESYTLPALINGNYFDQPNGSGTPFTAGDVLIVSQTLYVYAGIGGCSNENDFAIQIDSSLPADNLDDVVACENYILPIITNGKYFNQSNGAGTELFSGDILETSQTIFIYHKSGSCTNENSFTITIDSLSCEETPKPESKPEISCTVDFPKFFTPNNDGAHDKFVPVTDSCSPIGILSIYNRYGQLLFQTNSLSNTWDGTFKGKPLPSSDYWYRFESAESNEVITGHFSLKR